MTMEKHDFKTEVKNNVLTRLVNHDEVTVTYKNIRSGIHIRLRMQN